MDENKNHINKKPGEQLPSHSPDPGTWQRLSDKLDVMDAESAYQEKLQGLPVHSPDQGTWNVIYSQLNRIAFYKTGIRIAISVAAGLLLLFTVSRILDQDQKMLNSMQQVVKQEKLTKPQSSANRNNALTLRETETLKPNYSPGNTSSAYNKATKTTATQETKTVKSESVRVAESIDIVANSTRIQEPTVVEKKSEVSISKNVNILITKAAGNETTENTENSADFAAQRIMVQDSISPVKDLQYAENEPKSILFQKEQYTTISPLKSSSPVELKPLSNKNHFALAMNYLPENIKNGTNTSLFHNVDLTASYNKEKIRFNTSLGMAYNEEQLEFQVSYDINTPVTAFGQGGKLDTLSYNSADMASEYTGNEKHEYFTYNLGLGRRLISSGKFSTWINLGAGFGLLLNNPDIVASTTDLVKSQNNALSVRVNSSKPVYNDVNVNFVTAIDFNYMIINRLSITFTPTSRWYLKPVLSLNNQATDNLTIGFKTGIKFDF